MIKATGIVRKVDPLGRVVLPKELRQVFNMPEGTSLEMFTNDLGEIILKKYVPGCRFCGNVENLVTFGGENVCRRCINSLLAADQNQRKIG